MGQVLTARLTTPNGRPLSYADLGTEVAEKLDTDAVPDAPVDIPMAPQTSKAGNTYFQWDMNGVRLPDGFATGVTVEGEPVPMGVPRESRNGNMMCDGAATIEVGGRSHRVKALIVRTRRPYWVKIIAHVAAGRRPRL